MRDSSKTNLSWGNGPVAPRAISRRAFTGMAAVAGMSLLAGVSLAGCASSRGRAQDASSNESVASDSAVWEGAQVPQGQAQPQPVVADKTLVAVFSWSGHTLQMAQYINSLVESDFFRIESSEPYTQDYERLLDVARSEQNADARPALAATVDNWNEYGTIYLGYPVWWYKVPRIIKTFFDTYDFRGKTVVPFATSGGSSISGTLSEIQAMCPDAQFLEGLTLDGDNVASQLGRVDTWIGGLGL